MRKCRFNWSVYQEIYRSPFSQSSGEKFYLRQPLSSCFYVGFGCTSKLNDEGNHGDSEDKGVQRASMQLRVLWASVVQKGFEQQHTIKTQRGFQSFNEEGRLKRRPRIYYLLWFLQQSLVFSVKQNDERIRESCSTFVFYNFINRSTCSPVTVLIFTT